MLVYYNSAPLETGQMISFLKGGQGQMNLQLIFSSVQSKLSLPTFLQKSCHPGDAWRKKSRAEYNPAPAPAGTRGPSFPLRTLRRPHASPSAQPAVDSLTASPKGDAPVSESLVLANRAALRARSPPALGPRWGLHLSARGSRPGMRRGRRASHTSGRGEDHWALTGYTCRCTRWRWSQCRHSLLRRCSS